MNDPTLTSVRDAQRSGRPSVVPTWARGGLVQLVCERPPGSVAPFRQVWTRPALANALWRLTGVALSVSQVGRILRNAELRPHRVRQWLHSADPNFTEKAQKICELYLKPPTDAVVLCVDEKPMQALQRAHPSHVDWRDAGLHYEFEYKRHGIQVLMAAFDVRTGVVITQIVPKRTAEATVTFMDNVARVFPGKNVYVVWDNLSTHCDGPAQRWTRFNERHGGRFTSSTHPRTRPGSKVCGVRTFHRKWREVTGGTPMSDLSPTAIHISPTRSFQPLRRLCRLYSGGALHGD